MAGRDTTPLAKWIVGSGVRSIAISHDGTRLVSGCTDSCVRVWDISSGKIVVGPLKGRNDWIRSVAFSHDDSRIVSTWDDGTIHIWDASNGTPIGLPLRGHTKNVLSLALSPDGAFIVSGSADRTIRIWDARTGVPIGEPLKGHTGSVESVAFSPDSARIVSGSGDRTIRLWDASTGSPLGKPLIGHGGGVCSVSFSPDGTIITSSSSDKTIRIWDALDGASIGEPLANHDDTVRSVNFSLDGARIVSCSSDRTICVWDVRTGALVGEPLEGHSRVVSSVIFSSDGSRIFSCSWDGTICIWETPRNTSFDMVSSKMSAEEMFDCLVSHGCTNLTIAMNPGGYSSGAIATGGFGDVWQGRLKNGILVAIKCLRLHTILVRDKKGMKRAVRELHHWSKARHENVQELLGIVMFQGRLGMVSQWMENGTLHQYIRDHPEVNRYSLCIQVANGVSYLHSIGMVHGDIKALNVLVSADGIAKVNDFDYSTLSDSTLRFSETSKTLGGTLRWMAPELLQHQEEGSPAITRNKESDVYALGMTMLEIITGKIPYSEYNNEMAIYGVIFRKELPRRPKELPEEDKKTNQMWELLVKCWDHNTSARPAASFVVPFMEVFVI